ncbi:MAG: phosphoadenosine phosphosulfate reductase [Kiritimatiellaceae bacterium]|nr:phosphoadenosine phosphosulfate reductase [Kiritimatiellaceae bacterium]
MSLDQHTTEALDHMSAYERVSHAQNQYGTGLVMSTSFGIQSVVMLHLVKQQLPQIPIIFIDTGYLFPETYAYAKTLTDQLKLNIKTYRANLSAAQQEERYGQLWEQGESGLEKYNQINKVEPMQRALEELQATAWISGIRRNQSQSRRKRPAIEKQNNWIKIYPIIDWDDQQVEAYLNKFDLPPHPLKDKGYVSVGDWHTSVPLAENMSPEETRFHGLKRECGLHLDFNQGGGI